MASVYVVGVSAFKVRQGREGRMRPNIGFCLVWLSLWRGRLLGGGRGVEIVSRYVVDCFLSIRVRLVSAHCASTFLPKVATAVDKPFATVIECNLGNQLSWKT